MATCLAFPPAENDEMKLRTEDKNELFDEIHRSVTSAVESAMAAAADSLHPHGWRKVLHVLRALVPLGVTVGTGASVILTLLGLALTEYHAANSRLADEAQFEQKTGDRLDHIEKDLGDLKVHASVEPVSSAIRFAKVTAAKLNPDELKKLSEQLATAEDQYPQAPEVWKTTADFINYKSDTLTPGAANMHQELHRIDCSAGGAEIKTGAITFTNCRLSLDRLVNGGTVPVYFIHCILEYHGGALPPDPLFFRDCLFHFQVSDVPPARGVQTMKLLAHADNMANVSLPS